MKISVYLKSELKLSAGCLTPSSGRGRAKVLFLPVIIAAFAFGSLCEEERPTVVCTTTLLSAAAQALAGGSLEIATVIPWGMCPGHFEPSPREIENVRSANLILAHGMERFLDAFAAGGKTPTRINIKIDDNWLIPRVQVSAAEQIAEVLIETFPGISDTIQTNLAIYKKNIEIAAAELLARAAPLKGAPAVCSSMNKNFAEWLGLAPVAGFPRDEDLSLRDMRDAIRTAKEKKALLVVENRQSSGKTGRTIARELGIPMVTISNFPEPDANGRCSYLAALKENAEAIFNALANASINVPVHGSRFTVHGFRLLERFPCFSSNCEL